VGIEGDLAALSFSVSRTRSLCRFERALSVPGGCSSAGKQSAHVDMSQLLIPRPSKWLRDRLFLSQRALWKHGHPTYSSAPRATTRSMRPVRPTRKPHLRPGCVRPVWRLTEWLARAISGVCGASDSRIEATLLDILRAASGEDSYGASFWRGLFGGFLPQPPYFSGGQRRGLTFGHARP
jgi:hypothetical protein